MSSASGDHALSSACPAALGKSRHARRTVFYNSTPILFPVATSAYLHLHYLQRLGFWDVLYLRPSDKASFDLVKKLFFVGSPGRRTGLLGGSPQFAVNRGMTTTEELWCGGRYPKSVDKRPLAPPRPPRPPRPPPSPPLPLAPV